MKCIICNNKIKANSDKWVQLKDFNRGEETGICFYHTKCWKDKFKVVRERINEETKKNLRPAVRALQNTYSKIEENFDEGGDGPLIIA